MISISLMCIINTYVVLTPHLIKLIVIGRPGFCTKLILFEDLVSREAVHMKMLELLMQTFDLLR